MLTSARPLWWWTVLIVAVTSWVTLLLLDVLQHLQFPLLADPLFDVDTDRGAAECAAYVFLFVSAVSLLLTWRGARRRSVLWVLGVFLLVLLADDMFEIHERVGAQLGERAGWSPIVGIGPPTLGSWAMWGLVVGPFILLFTLTWEQSRIRARRGALEVIRWLAVLLFFAVVVDALRPITGAYGLEWSDDVAYVLKLIEFSGEFTAYVGLCMVAVRLALERKTPPRSPRQPRGAAAAPTGNELQDFFLPEYDDALPHQDPGGPDDAPSPDTEGPSLSSDAVVPPLRADPAPPDGALIAASAGTTTGSAAGTRRRRRPITMPTDSPSR